MYFALKTILSAKYTISRRLIIEKPVKSPIVPPTVARMLVNLAASSMVTRSNVGVSKKILTKLRLFGIRKSNRDVSM